MQALSSADIPAVVQCCPNLQHVSVHVGELHETTAVNVGCLADLQHLPSLSSLGLHVNILDGAWSALPSLTHLTKLTLEIRSHRTDITYVDQLSSWVTRMCSLRHLTLTFGSLEFGLVSRHCLATAKAAVQQLMNDDRFPQHLSILEVRGWAMPCMHVLTWHIIHSRMLFG